MSQNEIIAMCDRAHVGNYLRYPAVMEEGRGCVLVDADGREYLDFLSGIAVCVLGHCHPAVVEAIRRQAGRLLHVSNLFYTEPQARLADALVRRSFADKVFFANSGAEANEAAIKLARIASPPGKYGVISLEGSFHGRTLATVAATGQPKFHEGFEPMPDGFVSVPFGDIAAMEAAVSETTCAIMCEPLQGESGVRPLGRRYLAAIRELCDRHGLLLIFDEVQVGMGRTGALFAHERLGVVPDIMTLAKGIAGGLPLGAMLTTDRLAAALVPGSHASTFGGNPVSCAAANAVLDVLTGDGFLEGVRETGEYLAASLAALAEKHPALACGTRGMGLIQALVLTEKGAARGTDMVKALFDEGVLANFAGNAVLRFVPPLIVSREEIDRLAAVLDKVLARHG